MSTLIWSVRFALDDADVRAISGVRNLSLAVGVRALSLAGPPSEDPSEPSTVTFELEAIDAREARIRAQHLLGEAKRAARLRVEPSLVVWVAALADGGSNSSHRFLEAAEELIEWERYDLAVVSAQIHLEAHVAALVRSRMASEPSPVVRAIVERNRDWAPHRPGARALLEALLGVPMDSFPLWREYSAHVTRRNAVVHRGQPVDEASARSSVEVALQYWLWINNVAGERGQ